MARGFESKSVASQQESAFGELARDRPVVDAAREERRRNLELTRADLARQLEATAAEARRTAIRQALDAIDAELAGLASETGRSTET